MGVSLEEETLKSFLLAPSAHTHPEKAMRMSSAVRSWLSTSQETVPSLETYPDGPASRDF